MEAKKTPRTRTVKKTPSAVTPEVKLQESVQVKHYERNNHHSTKWSIVRIIIMMWLIVWAYITWVTMWLGEYKSHLWYVNQNPVDPMIEHCQLMPEMPGCEKYIGHTWYHDPLDMSMRDMGKMLEGKTGSGLEKAFLEGMIPHHEGAIMMAKYLTGEIRPELKKMGEDIINAQNTEIEQMKRWLIEWWYASGSLSPTPTEKIAI